MAYQSSGRTNDEMVHNLRDKGLIVTEHVFQAFLLVDRRHFLSPHQSPHSAYLDEPLVRAPFHLSAPHMYATIMESLDLRFGLSVLNIGSGTGYLSHLMASIVGPLERNCGMDIHPCLIQHAKSRCATVPALSHLNFIDFRVGDGLHWSHENQRFDRIYVGASIHPETCLYVADMLTGNGKLIAPVGNELVRLTRTENGQLEKEVLMHVHFSELVLPSLPKRQLTTPPAVFDPNGMTITNSSAQGIATAKILIS